MLRACTMFAGFAALSMSMSPAFAQGGPRVLSSAAGKPWKHDASGVRFAPVLGGIPRQKVTDFSDREADVSAVYELPDQSELISIYVYQAAVQDAPLWFAEAQAPIIVRKDYYGTPIAIAPPVAFAPRGSAIKSGLRMTYAASGLFRSTALAVAPLGTQWIVKLRYSSKSKSAAELDAALTQVIDAVDWPAKASPHAAAVPIPDCTSPSPTYARARVVAGNGDAALLGGLLGGAIAGGKDDGATGVDPDCRDKGLSGRYALYRRDAEPQAGYVLSVGDGGRAAIVAPDIMAMLIAGGKDGKADAKPQFSIAFVQPGLTTSFASHDGIPPPEQLIEILNADRWLSRTTRVGKKTTVTINSETMPK